MEGIFQRKKMKSVLVVLAVFLLIFVAVLARNARRGEGKTLNGVVKADFVTHVDRGMDAAMEQEWEKKVSTLEVEMMKNPKDISLMLQMGNLKYQLGDLASAQEWYERILSTHPQDAPALENLGQTLYEMGDFSGAQKRWRAALAIGPYEVTYLKLADLLQEKFPERKAEIQPLLEEAIATLGQTPGLLTRLGQWYAGEGRYQEALSHFEVAEQLAPDNTTLSLLIEQTRAAWTAAEAEATP